MLSGADSLFISAATLVEIGIVQYAANGEPGIRELTALMSELVPVVVPVTSDHAHIAFQAFQRYGRGQHRARLNFGDCFSYALAKETGQPLLFKGNDFSLTDLETVAF